MDGWMNGEMDLSPISFPHPEFQLTNVQYCDFSLCAIQIQYIICELCIDSVPDFSLSSIFSSL